MSFSTVKSAAMEGLAVEMVYVEADVSNGLPIFHMVGYLSSEVKEAAERVRSAVRNSGLEFPAKRVVINLSPATMRKRGASFDLPIAVWKRTFFKYILLQKSIVYISFYLGD